MIGGIIFPKMIHEMKIFQQISSKISSKISFFIFNSVHWSILQIYVFDLDG